MSEDNIVKFKRKDIEVGTELSGYAMNTDVSKSLLAFANESGNIAGRLFINDDDNISFEGNAEESAMQFFGFFVQNYEEYIRQMIHESNIHNEMISEDISKLKVVDNSTTIDLSQLDIYEGPLGQYEDGFTFKNKVNNIIRINEVLTKHIKYCYKDDTYVHYRVPVGNIQDDETTCMLMNVLPAHRYTKQGTKRIMLELHIMTSEVATIDDTKLLFDITDYFK